MGVSEKYVCVCTWARVSTNTKVFQKLLIFQVLTTVCSYPSGVNKQWTVSDNHTASSTSSRRLDLIEELSFIILLCNSRGGS